MFKLRKAKPSDLKLLYVRLGPSIETVELTYKIDKWLYRAIQGIITLLAGIAVFVWVT